MILRNCRPAVWIILLAPLLLGFSCQLREIDTVIKVKGDNPPTFVMTGSGTLDMLRIHGQKVREATGEAAYIVWEIVPAAGRYKGKGVESIGEITYGKVPEGYSQIYPEDGNAPPLIEDQNYSVFFDTVGANGARGAFVISQGKILWKPDDYKQRMLDRGRQ